LKEKLLTIACTGPAQPTWRQGVVRTAAPPFAIARQPLRLPGEANASRNARAAVCDSSRRVVYQS